MTRPCFFQILTLTSVLLACAKSGFPQDRLLGFRLAPTSLIENAPPGANLLDQAHQAVNSTDATMKQALYRELLDVRRGGSASFLYYQFSGQLAEQTWSNFLTALEDARTDEQKGTTQKTGGSTSLVSKPG